jgi:hypothetical protein
MKQKANNTMVNYGAPNGENLDDFMRLDASFLVSFNFTAAIKAYAVESSISLTDEDNVINRYYKVDQTINNTVTVNNKSLGMTPNVSFRVNFNPNKALLIAINPFQIQL